MSSSFKQYNEERRRQRNAYYEYLKPTVEELVNKGYNQTEIMDHLNRIKKFTIQGATWKYTQMAQMLDYLGFRDRATANNKR